MKIDKGALGRLYFYAHQIKQSIFLTVISIPDKGPASPTRSSTSLWRSAHDIPVM